MKVQLMIQKVNFSFSEKLSFPEGREMNKGSLESRQDSSPLPETMQEGRQREGKEE